MTNPKFTTREVITIVTIACSLYGTYKINGIRIDYIEEQQKKRDKEINEKIKLLDERAYNVLQWLNDNK